MTLLLFLLVLTVLVLSHEMGHFLMARRAGIRVEEFGFGYPPRAWGKKIKGTLYSINWLPLGGFVRLYGEDLESAERLKDTKAHKEAFWAKSKKARVSVILAGVVANFLLALLCFSAVYSYLGIPVKGKTVTIAGILPRSPADQAGVKENDVVLSIDGKEVTSNEQFVQYTEQDKGKQATITLKRTENNPCEQKVLGGGTGFSCQNGNLVVFLNVRTNPPQGEGPLGVIISDTEIKKFPFWQMPFRGTVEGFKEAVGWGQLILGSLGKMVHDLVILGRLPKDVSGPIGIYQATGQVAKTGFLSILQFIGILSVNLAIVNILPFPALDGGRLVFIVYEAITKRKPKPSFEQFVNTAGMALLLSLILLVTFNDLTRIVDIKILIESVLKKFH